MNRLIQCPVCNERVTDVNVPCPCCGFAMLATMANADETTALRLMSTIVLPYTTAYEERGSALYPHAEVVKASMASAQPRKCVTVNNMTTFGTKLLRYSCPKGKGTADTVVSVMQGITALDDNAFKDAQVSQVILPDTVKTIGSGAFKSCSKLTDISIPDSVTFICSEAFMGCTMLSSVKLPPSIPTISNSMFQDCAELTEIVMPDKVTSVGSEAFSGDIKLESVTFAPHVARIGEAAFKGCKSLVSIVVPKKVVTISESLFSDASQLQEVTLPGRLINIKRNAFSGCTALTKVHYNGTREQFNKISIADGNDALKQAQIICQGE